MSTGPRGTPPGYYPDNQGNSRWWDGRQWTEHLEPQQPTYAATQQFASPPTQQFGGPATQQFGGPATQQFGRAGHGNPPKKKPIYLRWWFLAVSGFVLILVIAGAIGGGTDDTLTPTALDGTSSSSSPASKPSSSSPASKPPSSSSTTPTPKPSTTTKTEVKKTEPAKPKLTVSQEQAISKAESYLDYTAFSRKGLVEQLKFEGFSGKDAEFAVANIKVNWNEQAAKKAQDYLDFSSFSRKGLIEQLEFDGFTASQARYGVDQVGL